MAIWVAHIAGKNEGANCRSLRPGDPLYCAPSQLTSTHPAEYTVIVFFRHGFTLFHALDLSPNIVGNPIRRKEDLLTHVAC